MRQVCFIDVQDPLAAHHELDKLDGELLALIQAADGVGSTRERLHLLELQPEVLDHNFPHTLLRQPLYAHPFGDLHDLCDAQDAAILLQEFFDCLLYGFDLPLAPLLLLDLLLKELHSLLALAGDAAYEADRDLV